MFLRYLRFFLGSFVLGISIQAAGEEPKSFLVSIPLVTAGREGVLRAETNLSNAGGIALEWVEWGQLQPRQELSTREIEENPKKSLATKGQDLGLMFSRYTHPVNMSGLHWGLGAGYRRVEVDWLKESLTADDESMSHYIFQAEGPTLSGRLGYRYVGSDLGFSLGGYLGAKHFQSRLQDDQLQSPETIELQDSMSFKRKMMTKIRLGIEAGWAF